MDQTDLRTPDLPSGDPTAIETREVTVPRSDGRTITATDQGPIDGPVVVFLHAAPGSRRFDPEPSATRAAGIRLVTIDRAGYGDSTPVADGVVPTVADQANDTRAVLEHLGITDASVVGWSGGGRVALALGAAHPHLVRRLALVATPAPDDEVPWVQPEHRAMSEVLRQDPGTAVASLTAIFSGAGDPTDGSDDGGLVAMVTNGGEADAAALEDPELRARIEAMVAFGFQHGPAGVATDIVTDQIVPWGFDLTSIGAPVTLVYGDADAVLGPEHGRWYAEQLVRSTLRVVPGAGHLVVVTEWAAILDDLITTSASGR